MPHVNTKIAGLHYQTMPCEVIEIIESIVTREQIPRKAAYAIGNAVKYLCRAGVKKGELWQEDVAKAENYLHRALSGEWKDPC